MLSMVLFPKRQPRLARVRPARPNFNLAVLALAALLLPATARAQTTYSGGGASFTTSDTSAVSSTISVTGAPGTVATVKVQLLGVKSTAAEYTTGPYANEASYDSLGYAEFLLKGPGGEQLVLLYQTGSGIDGCDENANPVPSCDGLQGTTTGSHPDTINIQDGAHYAPNGAGSLGQQYEGWQTADMPYTVEPSSYSTYDGDFPPPLPVSENTADYPQSDGSATLNGRFAGTTANGTWTLYLIDNDPYPGVDPFSITGWNLILTFSAATPTTTTLSSSANPASYPNSDTSGSVTFTATVTSTSTPTGSVTFQANGSNISGCIGVALSSGVAHCTVSLAQGGNSITASYTPTGSFGPSDASLTQLMEVTAANTTGDTWCNNSLIADPIDGNPGLAYPSVIKIPSGTYSKSVQNVTVELENAQGTTNGLSGQFLLVAPGGADDLDFFDSGFSQPGGETSVVDLTFSDSASGYVPITTAAASGTYLPTDDNEGVNPDFFPASTVQSVDSNIPQVPSKINFALPYGEDNNDYKPYTNIYTFAEAFNGATANGDWALYSTVGEGANINNGWCITFTFNSGNPTTTTLNSGSNPATTGQPLTFTATVTSSGSPVTAGGTVTFLDNSAAPAGTTGGNPNVVTLNGSGQATFTTSSLTEGDHTITANYSGVTGSDNASFSAVLNQRINTATTVTNVSSNTWQYCDPGKVQGVTTDPAGPLTPNPSVITVSNLPGTLNTVGVQLTNFSVPGLENLDQLESLVEGPTGAALDFFSNTTQGASGDSTASAGNYIFEDSASAQVSSGDVNLSPGSYKPTAYEDFLDAADKFTSSTSGFYPAPTTFSYAAPTSFGSGSTFADVFTNGSNANGTWSLFFNTGQSSPQSTMGAANGWCVNLTENLPSVSATAGHNGTFAQGQHGAQITLNITNSGPGSTGDPTGASPLTVTDTLNSAFTYSSFSGGGWSCSATGQTATCTNGSAIADGSGYPELTIDVNVSGTAAGSINNSVSVSGGGITSTSSNTDSITIEPAPVLSVSKTHTGTFTQGSTAQWNIVVSNAAASGATTGTVTVADTLPSGYTINSFGSTLPAAWTCSGTTTVSCTSTLSESGGSSYPTIQVIVDVPATSPTSVTNTALAWGGGDLIHASSGSAATGSDSSVPVVQVPASIAINGGGTQSATIGTAFGTGLAVTVKDAAGVAIQGSSVTFTAPPASGASGTFSDSSTTITESTGATGIANAGTFTANGTAGGPYLVTVADSPAPSVSFSLTNSKATETVTLGSLAQTYTGSPLSATATTSPVSGLTVTFTYTGISPTTYATSSTPPAAVGSYTVVGTISNPNYQGTATGTLVISPATETVTLGSLAQNYTGSPLAATATTSPVTGLTVTFTYTGISPTTYATSSTPPTAAGSYTVVGTISNPNYQGTATGTLVISPATETVTLGSLAQNYTGSPLAASATTSPVSGLTVTFTYTGISPTTYATSSTPPTAAGSYTVVGTISNPNYQGSATGTLVISPATVTVPKVVSYNVLWGTQSYNLIGSSRNRLPWEITGIQVVFSEPIAAADANSLTGVTVTGFSGLGTTTLTWTISPLTLGSFPTTLAGTGANAIKDAGGNALGSGAGFNQTVKVLYGDFNDDGVVNALDLSQVNAARSLAYNLYADMNGDGVVNATDVLIVRAQGGSTLP